MSRPRWLTLATLVAAAGFLLASRALGEPSRDVGLASPFGYTATNEGGLRFADEYQRLGGVDTLGYPASNRFRLPDGLTYQLTQGALLQWWPERNGVMVANTYEMLERAGLDDWLYSFKGIPRSIKDDGSGGDWAKAKEIRLGWLTHEAIKSRYLANPNPEAFPQWSVEYSIELYGLPMSRPERLGPFVVQRFQRIAFQLWLDEVSGMPAPGSVVRVLGGDLLKEARLMPVEALAPGDGPPAAAVPSGTPTATPSPTRVPTSTPVRATATLTPTPYPPHGAIPTPNPAHPPATGTFTRKWDPQTTVIYQTCGSPLAQSSGVFVNLAFTKAYVGKTLKVKANRVAMFYRSLVGEMRGGQEFSSCHSERDFRDRSLEEVPGYIDALKLGRDTQWGYHYEFNPLEWQIEYGQWFLYFKADKSPGTVADKPYELVTYTIAIDD